MESILVNGYTTELGGEEREEITMDILGAIVKAPVPEEKIRDQDAGKSSRDHLSFE